MSNRLFQGVIYQMKDAFDRTIGVIDENGVVISCSDLGKMGDMRQGVREELSFANEVIMIDGCTYRYMGTGAKSEYIVFVEGEDGEFLPAPDDTYTTEDGKQIQVVDGKVAAIEDPKAEVESEPEEEVEAAEEETVEPADEEETPAEEEPSEEDRLNAIEEKINAITEAINQMVNALAALEERIGEVESKLASVEAPQSDPIDETPVEEEKKTRLSYLRRD